MDLKMKSSSKLHHSAQAVLLTTGERQQYITTREGHYNIGKITPAKCNGFVRYDNDKLMKLTRQDYVDEDNIEWTQSIYENVCEDMADVLWQGKQQKECSDNESLKIIPMDDGIESSNQKQQDPCIKETSKKCNPQKNHREQNFQTVQRSLDATIACNDNTYQDKTYLPQPTSKKSTLKPIDHHLPDPEEYERMCRASKIAWNRCPGFAMKLRTQPVEMSPGMCNAWAACYRHIFPPCEQNVNDTKVNPSSAPSECEETAEEGDGLKKASTQCNQECEQADAIAATCPNQYNEDKAMLDCDESYQNKISEGEKIASICKPKQTDPRETIQNAYVKTTKKVGDNAKAWNDCEVQTETCKTFCLHHVSEEQDDVFNQSEHIRKCSSNGSDQKTKPCVDNIKRNQYVNTEEEILSNAEELSRCIENIKKLISKK